MASLYATPAPVKPNLYWEPDRSAEETAALAKPRHYLEPDRTTESSSEAQQARKELRELLDKSPAFQRRAPGTNEAIQAILIRLKGPPPSL